MDNRTAFAEMESRLSHRRKTHYRFSGVQCLLPGRGWCLQERHVAAVVFTIILGAVLITPSLG